MNRQNVVIPKIIGTRKPIELPRMLKITTRRERGIGLAWAWFST